MTEENLRPTAEAEDDNIGVKPAIVVGAFVVLGALALALTRRYLLAVGAAAAGWALTLIGVLGARANLIDRVEAQLVEPLANGKSTSDYVAIGAGFWLMTLLIAISVGLGLLANRADQNSGKQAVHS